MSKVTRLDTGEEPERFFDLEEENAEGRKTGTSWVYLFITTITRLRGNKDGRGGNF